MEHALPRRADDFAAWYRTIVHRAELADHGLVRGSMIIRPYGYAIWERLQAALDERIKATGHENVAFPLLIPQSVIDREADLVAGFAPEVAVVTHAGGERLAEPLVVRPTSESAVWATYARWIQSWRDLPLLLNQWGNVVRWERRPRILLRTSEFLWQEGHTAHATADEALAEARRVLIDVYGDVAQRVMAMPVLLGRKSARERFPGAVETFTMEALMPDGRALQAGTSHYLGAAFAQAYGVRFTDRDGAERYPCGTSWGVSTRLLGGLVMVHGDDQGLRLPPLLAPVQVVLVVIGNDDATRSAAAETCDRVAAQLRNAGVRVRVDDREELRPGAKFYEWELRGVPVRIEIGPRDVARAEASLVPRHSGVRETIPIAGVTQRVHEVLAETQATLFAAAASARDERTLEPGSYDELIGFLQADRGFAVASWCGDPACEARVADASSASIRCLPLDAVTPEASCVVCGRRGAEWATWARAY
jgi:prolyl-tRNA synthetase